MDLTTTDGRKDSFLLAIAKDWPSRSKTNQRFGLKKFNLLLEDTFNGMPQVNKGAFINDLYENKYIDNGNYGDEMPDLTALGYAFVAYHGGYSGQPQNYVSEVDILRERLIDTQSKIANKQQVTRSKSDNARSKAPAKLYEKWWFIAIVCPIIVGLIVGLIILYFTLHPKF